MPLLVQYRSEPLKNKRKNEPSYMAKCFTLNHIAEGKHHIRYVVRRVGKEKRWVRIRGKVGKKKKK